MKGRINGDINLEGKVMSAAITRLEVCPDSWPGLSLAARTCFVISPTVVAIPTVAMAIRTKA
jgi:hypothetical protein